MSDCEKCTPPEPADILFNPDVSVFREIALLHLPAPWRPALRHLGFYLFDWTLERFGIASEERDTLATSARRTEALSADLRSIREQLESLSDEAGESEMGEAEYRLLRRAGEIAEELEPVESQLVEVAAEALSAAREDC